MATELTLFIVSILPVFLIGMFIYKKDREKEPAKLLIKLFLGGIGSCFLVFILSYTLDSIFPIFSADTKDLNLIELIVLFKTSLMSLDAKTLLPTSVQPPIVVTFYINFSTLILF